MRKNYIRGYVTVTYDSDHDAYLIGYIFLENGGQHMHDVLDSFPMSGEWTVCPLAQSMNILIDIKLSNSAMWL